MAVLDHQWASDREFVDWYMGCPDPEYEAWCSLQDAYAVMEREGTAYGPWVWELLPDVPTGEMSSDDPPF